MLSPTRDNDEAQKVVISNLQSNAYGLAPKAKPLPTPPTRTSKNNSPVNGDISRTAQQQITQVLSQISNPSNTLQRTVKQQLMRSTMLCISNQQEDNINANDFSEKTSSLFLAVQQGHREVVQMLLESKAIPSLTSDKQETVLHIAIFYGYTQILEDLLKNPYCKQFINVKDQDGKTPLHKAMLSQSSQEMVTLLVANGADVNATDKYGYTALHWAAKNGDCVSAELLLKNGAKVDLANINGDLPFDLAIRHGSDDFIHFILQTPQRVQKPNFIVNDIEGHQYKHLLAAKKEGLIEEQILHLQVINDLYIQKKDFFKGAKVLNAALALLYQLPAFGPYLDIFERYMFARLEQIEVKFIESKGLKPSINRYSLIDHRNQLKKIRQEAKIAQAKGRSVKKILANLTSEFKTLLSAMIADAQNTLGKARWETKRMLWQDI